MVQVCTVVVVMFLASVCEVAVWAAVYLRPGHESVPTEELIDFCRQFLAGYKIPKGVELHAEPLPKSGPGKFLKRRLREPHWEGHDRAVH